MYWYCNPKCYRPVRLVDFLISNISRRNEQILLTFGMYRAIKRRKILRFVGWVRSGIPRYVQSFPKVEISGNLEIVTTIFWKKGHKWFIILYNFFIKVNGLRYYFPIKFHRLQYSIIRNISKRKRRIINVLELLNKEKVYGKMQSGLPWCT